jgi:hypothetical protein
MAAVARIHGEISEISRRSDLVAELPPDKEKRWAVD